MSDPMEEEEAIRLRLAGLQAAHEELRSRSEELRSRSRLVLPEPEKIHLGGLEWLLELVKGPIPLDWVAHYEYHRVQSLILRIPGIAEFKHRLDVELETDLTGPALVALRRRLSRATGRPADEIERMLIGEIVTLPWAPPVICSQADVAKWFRKTANRSGYLETLKDRGIIRHYEPRGGKYAIWFADPEVHRRALEEISEGPKPRKS